MVKKEFIPLTNNHSLIFDNDIELEYLSYNDSEHVVKKAYVCTVCNYREYKNITEGHCYGDSGECILCDYVPACTHPSSQIVVDPDKTVFSYQSPTQHYVFLTYVCMNCGCDITTDKTVANHDFHSSDVCNDRNNTCTLHNHKLYNTRIPTNTNPFRYRYRQNRRYVLYRAKRDIYHHLLHNRKQYK